MIKIRLTILLLCTLFIACETTTSSPEDKSDTSAQTTSSEAPKPQRDNLAATIEQLAGDMRKSTNLRIDPALGKEFISQCQQFAQYFPQDTLSPRLLLKAGQAAVTIRKYPLAIECFDALQTKYPTHEKASSALFLQAFTYDTNLKDFKSAEKYYREFIERYPEDPMINDVLVLVDNISKTPEEIVKGFQNQ